MKKKIKEEREAKIFSIIFVFSIIMIAGLLIFSNWRISKKRKELLKEIESLKQEIENLEQQNNQLKQGIGEVEEESFWEAKIREQGYQKSGETAVVIKKEQESEKNQPIPKNIWEKFLAEIGRILK